MSNEAEHYKLFDSLGYPYQFYKPQLSIYSKHPIVDTIDIEYAQLAVIQVGDHTISITNLHLPWKSILVKEKGIVNISNQVSRIKADYKVILGDFNCEQDSSVQQFLKAHQSLNQCEVDQYWTDLTDVAEENLGVKRINTLDLKHNPRWKGVELTDISSEYDKIYIQDSHPKPYMQLKGFGFFGTQVDEDSGWCPSDHYGVYADLEFPE